MAPSLFNFPLSTCWSLLLCLTLDLCSLLIYISWNTRRMIIILFRSHRQTLRCYPNFSSDIHCTCTSLTFWIIQFKPKPHLLTSTVLMDQKISACILYLTLPVLICINMATSYIDSQTLFWNASKIYLKTTTLRILVCF